MTRYNLRKKVEDYRKRCRSAVKSRAKERLQLKRKFTPMKEVLHRWCAVDPAMGAKVAKVLTYHPWAVFFEVYCGVAGDIGDLRLFAQVGQLEIQHELLGIHRAVLV